MDRHHLGKLYTSELVERHFFEQSVHRRRTNNDSYRDCERGQQPGLQHKCRWLHRGSGFSAKHFRSFCTDDAKKCIATDYAITKGALASTWWWLRSPGSKSNYAALVEHTGSVWTVGTYVSNGNDAVRPAMWIDLTANTINS